MCIATLYKSNHSMQCLPLRWKAADLQPNFIPVMWIQFKAEAEVHLSLSHELDMHLITSSAVSSNTLRNPNFVFLHKFTKNNLRCRLEYSVGRKGKFYMIKTVTTF